MSATVRTAGRITSAVGEYIADTLTPVAAFQAICGEDPGFLLESVEGGERWGRYSFVGRRPLATVTAHGSVLDVEGQLPTGISTTDGVLAFVEQLLHAFDGAALEDLPPLARGLVGYVGYDVVREIERLPELATDDLGHPTAVLLLLGEVAVFDHWRQRVILVVNALTEHATSTEDLQGRLEQLAQDCFAPVQRRAEALDTAVDPSTLEVRRTMTSQQFRSAVEVAKEHIVAGDIFQVVLSQRVDFDLDADPFDVYRALRLLNPSPYLYFLRLGSLTVVGSSPEPMVRLREGVVTSRPIAGSRPRGATAAEDQRLAAELAEDPKELAEHVMLIDLARNDVGRVVAFGTEQVDEVMVVERYSHIMHLTSQVSGRLRDGLGPVDVLKATLPAGTLSGAPKVRAMEIIDQLEPTRRGVYGGVVGYLDFNGNLDTAIAIRTLVVDPAGRATIQAGAGIVADSDPVLEDEECLHKMAAVKAAVLVARAMGQR